MPRNYDRARALPPETLSLWMDAIAALIPASEVDTIVDVGCGTGRFSSALQETFSARVLGIDPSQKMLLEAAPKAPDSVEFRPGSAEEIPVETGTACLIFLSMVYHHIENRGRAIGEFHRALRPSGYVCVRTSTVDLLDLIPYLRFFPEARESSKRRLPHRAALVRDMKGGGFRLLHQQVVEQVFARTWGEYHTKISHRALSDLASISDEAFRAGLDRMGRTAGEEKEDRPVIEPIDLFVFRRESDDDNP
jgi:ubiquinone/menaquinone biosynthesis C-methylase UbiE